MVAGLGVWRVDMSAKKELVDGKGFFSDPVKQVSAAGTILASQSHDRPRVVNDDDDDDYGLLRLASIRAEYLL